MGLFGWLRPEEEGDRIVGEISNDAGDHAVFDIPAGLDNEGTVRRIMRKNKVEPDLDEQLGRRYDAATKAAGRNPEKLRYSMGNIVSPKEDLEPDVDLEPEVDNDEGYEHDEQSATGGWWRW
jgi:hypothetical protein